ncbi:hypothetical protein [Capnocytophaga sputigena]
MTKQQNLEFYTAVLLLFLIAIVVALVYLDSWVVGIGLLMSELAKKIVKLVKFKNNKKK